MTDAAYEKQWGKGPHLTADALVYGDNHILLIQRPSGLWAMPGGFVEAGEFLLDAALRELSEETNFPVDLRNNLVQTHIMDDPKRDPRSHMVSVVHEFWHGKLTDFEVKAGDDAIDAKIWPLAEALELKLFAGHDVFIKKLLG